MTTATARMAGRVALVTGASRGIGAATARALAVAGASVVLAARDEQALRTIADEITGRGGRALAVPTDVTDPTSLGRLVDRTLTAFGRLDAAVNNVGGGHQPAPLADVTVADFDDAVAVSLRGTFLAMKHEIPAMCEAGGGAIVNMASTGGLQAVGGLAGYISAKFAVVGLSRTAALDYGPAGIRVNALAPGPILTDHLERAGTAAQQQATASLPIRRLGRVEDVAAAAVWLLGPGAAFVTGAALPVDGGLLSGMPPFSTFQGRNST